METRRGPLEDSFYGTDEDGREKSREERVRETKVEAGERLVTGLQNNLATLRLSFVLERQYPPYSSSFSLFLCFSLFSLFFVSFDLLDMLKLVWLQPQEICCSTKLINTIMKICIHLAPLFLFIFIVNFNSLFFMYSFSFSFSFSPSICHSL